MTIWERYSLWSTGTLTFSFLLDIPPFASIVHGLPIILTTGGRFLAIYDVSFGGCAIYYDDIAGG